VAVITFGNPPVNSLGHPVRAELAAALAEAAGDAAVGAVVLVGEDGRFSAGADIREFGTPLAARAPTLPQLIAAIEEGSKPVVAAIAGHCLGGGLELALGCHYRVALADARLGLPEVKLGLLPGAGGTQRLPRLVGVENALRLIVRGDPVAARTLAATPLLDRVVEGGLLDAALEVARAAAARGGAPPRVRDRAVDDPGAEAQLQAARAAAEAGRPPSRAALRCVEAVAAARLPFAQGLGTERALFLELVAGEESRALRHVFFAERTASRVADVPESTPAREVRGAGVVGGGTMGVGIALCFLEAGLPVTLLEVAQGPLDQAVARIREVVDGLVRKGRLSPEQRDRRMALLGPTLSYEDLATADIVVEAVFEEMGVKEQVFGRLDRVLRTGAILATNTSTLDVDRLALATGRPADVVGTHFFSPAHRMRLLEVVRGARTAPDVLATVLKLARTLGKTAVVAGVCDGFIGNRMVGRYLHQAMLMLDEGSSPAAIDAAVERFGVAMGPFRMSDLAGNDVGWRIRKRHAAEKRAGSAAPLADALCESGRFGQKTGGGWYDYAPGERRALASPQVGELIDAHRRRLGRAPRALDDEEIVDRLVLALVNEGARLLEERIAARASDIDVVYVAGYGFPATRGGPMFHADGLGLARVVARMRDFAANPHADPAFWTPAPLLARLAGSGRSFADFDAEGA
jgi:3-hydroxyacyl-CoA dehydrogenase